MHSLEKRNLLPFDLKPITSLADYKQSGGLQGWEKAKDMTPQQIIDEVKKAHLRGRGGAGFPAAIKWQTVHDAPDSQKYVVCNGSEGEPGTFKDRYLLSKNPYILFEGMLIAAKANKACQAIIGIKEKYTQVNQRLEQALQEYIDAAIVDPGFFRIVYGPDEYLFGEEKALLNTIDGGAPMPRFFPPYMMGVNLSPNDTNPTTVNNIESFCHVSKILANGSDWFQSMGTKDTPGTVILTLSGDVKNPGMYEVETGLTVREMLYDLGRGPVGDKPFKALFSGYSNRVMTPKDFDLVMDFGTLRNAGFGLGSCSFFVYDESRCMVEKAWMVSKFLSVSSCGQCVPCNMGTRVVTEHLENLEFGKGSQEDIEAILWETKRCTNQTRCFLPQQEAIMIPNMIETFRSEFDYHAGHECPYANPIVLPKIKSFDEEKREFVYEDAPKVFEECEKYHTRFVRV